jgi:predicted component of type VI protein secretion system
VLTTMPRSSESNRCGCSVTSVCSSCVLLREELALPIALEPLPLRRVRLPPRQGCTLGTGCLGRDVVIGLERLDRMGQLAVLVGPVSHAEMLRLLPGGASSRRLVALTRLYLRQPLDLLLQVLVPAAEIEGMRVGGSAPSRLDPAAILGPPRQDPERFIVEISL